jgi:putative addiction module component (TIGR02574 family)
MAITKSLMDELLELSPEDRLQLVEDLWDSIGDEEMPPLTAGQMQEIERRYEELIRYPEKGATWDEVKAKILARYK